MKIEKENSTYQFSNVNGKILYGPYQIDSKHFFYYDGNVLNETLDQIENPQVRRIHKFYLKTYTDPLFYTPTESGSYNFSNYSQFENQKILAKECGLEYDVIPSKYFDSLQKNQEETNQFLSHPSRQNALELIDQNRAANRAYAAQISNFIDLLDKDLTQNDCFSKKESNTTYRFSTYGPVTEEISVSNLIDHARKANNNAIAMRKDINAREQILDGQDDFEIKVDKPPKLSDRSVLKPQKTPEEAKKMINDRREEEHIDLELNSKSLEIRDLEDPPESYSLRTYCPHSDDNESVSIYGVRKNIYPNIFAGQNILDEAEFENHPASSEDFFTVCRCPYVEITRLNWYNTDSLYEKVSSQSIAGKLNGELKENVENFESKFIEDRSQTSLESLADSYAYTYTKLLKEDVYNDQIPIMWRRSHQQKSKLNNFAETYDDFYNPYHMTVWEGYFEDFYYPDQENDEKLSEETYYYFLIMESEYALTFMTYSDSVWRIDEKPQRFV